MNFTVSYQVTNEQVSDLLCSAFEGGSNYWVALVERINPTTWEFNSEPENKDSHWLQDYPLNPGGAVILSDEDNERLVLDHDSIQKGLTLMAQKSPDHFADILRENEDAETGDVFLQYCVLGEIVYS